MPHPVDYTLIRAMVDYAIAKCETLPRPHMDT